MLKSTNNKENKPQTSDRLKVKAIKNGHTAAGLAESGERWANHSGPYLTLKDVLALEAAKQESV